MWLWGVPARLRSRIAHGQSKALLGTLELRVVAPGRSQTKLVTFGSCLVFCDAGQSKKVLGTLELPLLAPWRSQTNQVTLGSESIGGVPRALKNIKKSIFYMKKAEFLNPMRGLGQFRSQPGTLPNPPSLYYMPYTLYLAAEHPPG